MTKEQSLHLVQLTKNTSDPLSVSILHQTIYFPGSLSWKMQLYHWYNPILSSIHFTPLETTLLTLFWPELFLFGIFFLGYTLFYLVTYILRGILYIYTNRERESVFLRLTFPQDAGKTAYATEQLYHQLHSLGKQKSFLDMLMGYKKCYALEIAATKKEGILYSISVPKKEKAVITRQLLSFLPGLNIREVPDYLNNSLYKTGTLVLAEFKQSGHHSLPLQEHKKLSEHDPLRVLTGAMTKLREDELVSYQLVITPVVPATHAPFINEMRLLKNRIYKGKPLTPVLTTGLGKEIATLPFISLFILLGKTVWKLSLMLLSLTLELISYIFTNQRMGTASHVTHQKVLRQEIVNPYEQELATLVKGKIDQNQFETSIRLLVSGADGDRVSQRLTGLYAAFGPLNSLHQGLQIKTNLLPDRYRMKHRLTRFKKRALSHNTIRNTNPLLSASELADLFHFPNNTTRGTEDMGKLLFHALPPPLSLKHTEDFAIVCATNTYGGEETPIGLTKEDRRRHMMLFGQTGSGKSTLLYTMINQDIVNGNGLCVIDPHGQLAEETLKSVQQARRTSDLVWFNPDDLSHPIGINIMQTTPGLSQTDELREKEFIAESIISLFRKVFADTFTTNPHRIESILRNTIYTAFTVEGATLFTLYDLLTDPAFRAKTVAKLSDERLKKFWVNLYGKAGSWQQVKMIAPVTSRIERFLFSPSARVILEGKRSTISFEEIMDTGKILVCNLSKGKLGEDTSQVLGLLLLTKIQLTTLKRERIPENKRRDFYLYVDEFQNFATLSFVQMLSEARKYRLNLIVAEQSTAQQKDSQVTNILFANTATVIVFKTASTRDEELLLPLFAPFVKKGEIQNLPAYHFYMKLGGMHPEEPFSGITIPVTVPQDTKAIEKMLKRSHDRYTAVQATNNASGMPNNHTIQAEQLPENDVSRNQTKRAKRTVVRKEKSGSPELYQ